MTDPNDQNVDLIETIVAEFTAALRQGQKISIAEYQARYPELAEEIDEVLSSVEMIEQLKSASDTATNNRRLLDDVSKLENIGPYKILREVGRGGMGVVFEATHLTLGRHVAIKVLPTPLINGDSVVERFQREAQAAARLHHTNIVSVFGASEGPGYHYYVMDFVDGQPLNVVIDQMRTGKKVADVVNVSDSTSITRMTHGEQTHYRWAARLAAQMADALSHAHACSILHRDLKPSNMILDTSGRVWLTDFGLAKDGTHQKDLTKTGDVIGTPQYLPPESLELQYDIRSETYGVGLVLYELIALQPAFTGASPAELLRAIASRSPQPIRKVVREVPVDLATIIDKAIAREPLHRYQTAAELQRDLMAFVEDRPISARRLAFWETGYRWAKRNPLAASLSATSALLLVLVAASASVGYFLTTTALRKEAQTSQSLRLQQEQTERAKQEAENNFLAMKSQYDRAESNVALSLEGFDEIFQYLVSRGNNGSVDQDIEGLREISGIGTSMTTDDAKFLDGMVKFYEQFAQLNAENDTLKAESAKAYRRVGNIYQIVGQLQPAIAAYEKCLTLLPVPSPDDVALLKDDLLTRARVQNELSAAYRKYGQLQLAQEWNRKSIRLLENSPLSQKDTEVRLELARSLSALGFDVLRSISTSAKPRAGIDRPFFNERFNNERNDSSERSGERPGMPDRPNIGERGFEIGKRMLDRANRPLVLSAIKILDQLIEEDPKNGEYIAVRATCYWCLAAADLERDRDSGFENRNKAISALNELVESHPENSEYQYLLALACGLTTSSSEEEADSQEEEHKLVQRGADLAASLLDRHPNVLDYHHLYAKLKIKLAGYLIQKKQRDAAYDQLQAARASIQFLTRKAASDRSFLLTMNALSRELMLLEALYRDAGNPRVAAEIVQMFKKLNQPRK
jgi:eukaryotic-like serine/threonine-protein kinase